MKTLGILLALVAGGFTGATLAKKEQQQQHYTASVSFEFGGPMTVNYSSDEGAVEHWIHCADCKQGVISNGACTYCRKNTHEQPKNN